MSAGGESAKWLHEFGHVRFDAGSGIYWRHVIREPFLGRYEFCNPSRL
jgi:hypothetical protein